MAETQPGQMRHHLHRKDLFWLLAYPLYQLIGSLRHEASHALVAVSEGARIQEFVFWPSFAGSAFRWGYVSWAGSTDWVATAAPYLCDLATFAFFFVLCARRPRSRHWVWVNLVAVGLVSPLVNLFYNYCLGLGGRGDVAQLVYELPGLTVHTFFVSTLVVYAVGLAWTLWPRAAALVAREG